MRLHLGARGRPLQSHQALACARSAGAVQHHMLLRDAKLRALATYEHCLTEALCLELTDSDSVLHAACLQCCALADNFAFASGVKSGSTETATKT